MRSPPESVSENEATRAEIDRQRVDAARAVRRRYGWLLRVRPASVASIAKRILVPDGRFIVPTNEGAHLFVDPLSNFGDAIVSHGEYEPEVAAIFRQYLRQGDAVWDVGANEGYFSVRAAELVGSTGRVLAIEPQTRLRDVIQINLALNEVSQVAILRSAALAATSGETVQLNLAPDMNTGSTSIVSRYRWSRAAELVPTLAPADALRATGREIIDFVKVDVEGFEATIVPALEPLIREGRIRRLLIDFHLPQLSKQGTSAARLHGILRRGGMAEATPFRDSGYVLYELQTAERAAARV